MSDARKIGEQFALQIYYSFLKDEINKQLKSGCKFVAHFESTEREHIVIFEKIKDDKKTRGKNSSISKR